MASGNSGVSLCSRMGPLGPLVTDVYFIGTTLDNSLVQNADSFLQGGAGVSGTSGVSLWADPGPPRSLGSLFQAGISGVSGTSGE